MIFILRILFWTQYLTKIYFIFFIFSKDQHHQYIICYLYPDNLHTDIWLYKISVSAKKSNKMLLFLIFFTALCIFFFFPEMSVFNCLHSQQIVLLVMLRDEVSAESEMSTSALSSRFRPNQSLGSPPSQANASTKNKNAQERERRQVARNFGIHLKSEEKKTEWQSVRSPKNKSTVLSHCSALNGC